MFASDAIALSYYYSYSLPVTIIRPFNTFGPRQSIRAIIPTVINQILDGKKKIKLGNISAYRDFNYVTDTVDAFINVIRSNKDLSGETFNFGSSYRLTIKELVHIIAKIYT